MTIHKHFSFYFGLFCLLIVVVGCGSNPSLKGRVVFADDQTPLDSGTICFVSDKGIARGTIGPGGNYVVGSVGKNDGLPPGTYRVYLVDTEIYEPSLVPGGLPTIIPRIAVKYTQPETSGLTVEVKSSTTFDIQAERYVRPR